MEHLKNLKTNWDSYGAEPPNDGAILKATEALTALKKAKLIPDRVVASAEGGVGIIFVRGDRYADVEFRNDGEILMSSYRREEPALVSVVSSVPEIIEKIRQAIIETP